MFNFKLGSELLAPTKTTSVENNKTRKEREKENKNAVLWLSINFFSINNPEVLQIAGEQWNEKSFRFSPIDSSVGMEAETEKFSSIDSNWKNLF